jgi:protein-S-isoprenylcysteine O-methyltransferase Ste14
MSRKAVLPPTYLLIALIMMVALGLVVPVVRTIPSPWHVLGIVPLAVGIVLNLIADNAFRRVGTTVKPFQQSTALVTRGAYGISRHPMYLGYVLILVGAGVMLARLTPFLVIPIFAVLMDRVFIRVEEQMLEETFRQAWASYKARVRRWL